MDFNLYIINTRGIFKTSYDIFLEQEHMYTVRDLSFWSSGDYIFESPLEDEVIRLKKRATLWNAIFNIFEDGRQVSTIELDALGGAINVKGLWGELYVKGNFFGSAFTIFQGEEEVAKVSKKSMRSKGRYGIAIKEGMNDLLILSLVIVLENRARTQGT